MKRYHRYDDIPIELLTSLGEKVADSPYRQLFHIEGDMGYINDPNGVCYFEGEYHLFYQWSPLTYSDDSWFQGWYHMTSKDLLHWSSHDTRIEPDSFYESHGAYSGSAIAEKDYIRIFYTGNTRNSHNERIPYQIIATLDKEGQLSKVLPPAITGYPDGYTDHFRDPKLWKNSEGYFAVIGAQRNNLTGTSLLLFSEEGLDWEVLGEVDIAYQNFGYMWECPNYFEIDNKGIFLFSPQGIKPEGSNYKNLYQTGFVIGERLSKTNLKMTSEQTFVEIDRGFDFYAAQVMQAKGRTFLLAWMGLPEIVYPTEEYTYSGCLTLPRELFLEDGQLKQRPLQEIDTYRIPLAIPLLKNHYKLGFGLDIELRIEKTTENIVRIDLAADYHKTMGTQLLINFEKSQIILDRTLSGEKIAEEFGTDRLIAENIGDIVDLRIFLDRSSIEIFVNDGDFVASSRIFPTANQQYLHLDRTQAQFDLKVWKLEIGETTCV